MKTNPIFPLRSISTVMVLFSSLEKVKRVRVSSRVTRRSWEIFLLYILSMFFWSLLVRPEVFP